MAGGNNFSRLLIVNGQPILIKNEIGLNPVQNISSDILQQAIDVTSSETISPIIDCGSNGEMNSEQNMNVVDSSSERSEFVTVLSTDQRTEDASTIRLTLEQASELGLQFTVDNIDLNLESSTSNKEDSSTMQNQYVLSSTRSSQATDTEYIKLNSEITHSLTQNVDMLNKGDECSPYLDSFHPVDSSQNQQLKLVPHILNGQVTYTIQLSNQTLNHTSNSEFFRMNESSIITLDSDSTENELQLDLSSLSTSSDLPFINSPVDIVSNKPVHNIDNTIQTNSSSQTYGLVSGNSENVTFLSLSDVIPAGVSISNIVTHVNNFTSQQKSYNTTRSSTEVITKQKVFVNQGGESLLLKQRNLSKSQNGLSISHSQSSKDKTKMIGRLCLNNRASGVLPKTIINDSTNCPNVCIEQTAEEECSEESTTSGNKLSDKMDSVSSKEELINSLKNIAGSTNKRTENKADARHTPTIITPRKGDVPKEVSVALSRIPIKTDCNKPLGSNENPIQLVQQGNTFHSMQALTEDHISKIKPILQENFDTKMPSKNVVYDPASNTRIIYRIINPAEVALRKEDEFPKRRGRPKKVRSMESQQEEIGEDAPPPKKMFPRTRSGRLSRPPKHMVRDYKHLRRAELDDSDGAYSDYQSEHEEDLTPLSSAPVDLLPGLVSKRKSHKRNISAGNLCPTCGKIYLGYVRMKRHFDKYPDHGSIEYLNTIRNSHPDSEAENHRLNGSNGFWKKGSGRRKGKGKNNFFTTGDKCTRLKEALEWCQSKEVADIAGPAVASVLSLWELLMLRVDCVKNDCRVVALYQELHQLLCKLRQVAHRIFRPLDHPLPPGTKRVTVEVEGEMMTGLLNIPSGVYVASDEDLNETSASTIQKLSKPETQRPSTLPVIEKKAKKKNIQDLKPKVDIVEGSQPFLLTSEEMICDGDERGLVNVDEIVSLQNFTGSQSSSVDELMKGLNELEQRNKLETDDLMEGFSIVSRRAGVSASTEDLMKSLEHLESLNHAGAPGALDRDSFDRVSNVDTLDFEVLSREFHSNNR